VLSFAWSLLDLKPWFESEIDFGVIKFSRTVYDLLTALNISTSRCLSGLHMIYKGFFDYQSRLPLVVFVARRKSNTEIELVKFSARDFLSMSIFPMFLVQIKSLKLERNPGTLPL
jgi:hypothetical protein